MLFIFLASFSYFTHFTIQSHKEVPPQLLVNNSFSAKSEGWDLLTDNYWNEIEITANKIKLSSITPQSFQISQTIKGDKLTPVVLLRAKVKSDSIKPGEQSWNKGRVLLVQYNHEKPMWSLPHALVSISGTQDWKQYNSFFIIDSQTDYIKVAMQLSNSSGDLYCKDIKLYNAVPNSHYVKIKHTLYLGWAIFTLLLFYPYIRRQKYIGLLLTILTAVTLFGITMEAAKKNDLKALLNSSIKNVSIDIQNRFTQLEDDYSLAPSPSPASVSKIKKHHSPRSFDITKIAHFCLFMTIGFIISSIGTSFIRITLDILLFASTTEILQLFIPGRSALLGDVIIDFSGGLIGMLLFLTIAHVVKSRIIAK